MLRDIYGEEFERSSRAKRVYQKLTELEIAEINIAVFTEFTNKHKAMLYPAYGLQLNLKRYIMGVSFWKKQSAVRLAIGKGKFMAIRDIIGQELYQKQIE